MPAMCICGQDRSLHAAALAFLLVATASCGRDMAADPKNREVPWTYGPTTGGATSEHVQGTGKQGSAAIAKGWQFRLQDGKRLTVRPYQLAESHPLFGKVAMSVGLFDKTGKELGTVDSAAITAQNATFTFELTDTVANQLCDVVIWYCRV